MVRGKPSFKASEKTRGPGGKGPHREEEGQRLCEMEKRGAARRFPVSHGLGLL